MDQRDRIRALHGFLADHRGMERRQLLRSGLGLALAALVAPIGKTRAQAARPVFTADAARRVRRAP